MEWTANFSHPLSFPSLSLFVYFFLYSFPFRFVQAVSPILFLRLFLGILILTAFPTVRTSTLLHTARQF